jgi:uncharacterized OB-fold protein
MTSTVEVPARENLVEVDPPALLGGECGECGLLSFPLERYCAHCGAADPDRRPLPTTGSIYSFSIVHFAAPGYAGEVPYAVGVVELDRTIRVATTLLADPLDSLRVGAAVEFELLEIPTAEGDAVLGYAYSQVAA